TPRKFGTTSLCRSPQNHGKIWTRALVRPLVTEAEGVLTSALIERPTWDWTGAPTPVYRLRPPVGGSMRRIALVIAAAALVGCSSETTSPSDSANIDLITQFTNSAFSDAFTAAGGYD